VIMINCDLSVIHANIVQIVYISKIIVETLLRYNKNFSY